MITGEGWYIRGYSINKSRYGYTVKTNTDSVKMYIQFLCSSVKLISYSDWSVFMVVLAQDAIQAALKDYKIKNEGTDDGGTETSAKSTAP